jgi:site-specific DNA recombinase
LEKKEFMKSFIERVEIFPERQPDGRILRRIDFRFPVFFEGKEVDMLNWDTQAQVETVVLMSQIEV